MSSDTPFRKEALEWALRTNDPAFDDWDHFTLWLEARPEHAEAYDAICAAVADGADLLRTADLAPVTDTVPELSATGFEISRRKWFGGAIAASLVLVLGLGLWQQGRPSYYTVATAPGEFRTHNVEEGTSIALSGDTKITLDRKNPREVELERGEAVFTVRHDAGSPFRVLLGDDQVVDVGTVFNIRREGQELNVSVSEGAVQFNPHSQDVRLGPGELLRRSNETGRIVVSSIAVERIGEWRDGRLTFEGASLQQVASDLTRVTGIAFYVEETGTGARRSPTVSGSVLIDPIRQNPRAIGSLLGLDVTPTDRGWSIRGL